MGNLRNRLLKILLVLLALSAALFGGCILYLAITDPIKSPYGRYFYPILLAICLSAVPFFTGLFYGYRGADITENQNLRHLLRHPFSAGNPLLDWSGRSR